MTQIYIASLKSVISAEKYDNFLQQYSQRKPLHKITLCSDLAMQWSNAVKNRVGLPDSYTVILPSASHLSEYVQPNKQGLYVIYAKFNLQALPECFYIGISEKNIYGRLSRHLHGDIYDDYRHAFKILKKASEIVICYNTALLRGEKVKNSLKLLEDCMTVLLRPNLLVRAAK